MKKILFAALMLTSFATAAHGYGVPTATARPVYVHGHGHGGGFGWVVPMVVGGVVGYAVGHAQQPTVVVQPTPQVVPQPYYTEQVQVVPQCGPWREIQQQDGTVVRERVCR